MAIEVFWSSGSPFSWRVLLALELKGVAYTSRLLEFSKGDLRKPEFLAVNPRGLVPALRDGDFTVHESVAILAYLDRRFPEPPLFGRSAEAAGRIWQHVVETVNYLDGPTDAFILPLYGGKADAHADEIRALIPKLQHELERFERELDGSDWLVAPALSAADIVAYPLVRSLLRAVGKPAAAQFEHGLEPFSARYPRLSAWMGRIEALPGYEQTFPPHWRGSR